MTDNPVPYQTIGRLVRDYEALLFDAYGVLVDSDGIREGARMLISALVRMGKPFYVVTNDASRTIPSLVDWYQSLGLEIGAERIISSGSLLSYYCKTQELSNPRCIVLGPDDSQNLARDAGGEAVPVHTVDADCLVLCDERGYPFRETMDFLLTLIVRRWEAGRAIKLVLPNPDQIYPSRTGYGFAAGSLALMFENALDKLLPEAKLRFERLGKPEAPIFEEAFRRSGTRNMVMIGDQIDTDILGARRFGIDAALLRGSLNENLQEFASPDDPRRPTYLIKTLQGPILVERPFS